MVARMPPVPVENKKIPSEDSSQQDHQVQVSENLVIPPGGTSSEDESENENSNAYDGYELLSGDGNVTVHQQFDWQDMDEEETDEEVGSAENPAEREEEKNDEDKEQQELPYAQGRMLPNSIFQQFQQALDSSSTVHLKDSDFPIKDTPRTDSLPLDEEKIQTIKSCMAGFTLPASNFPKWAKNVSEDDWKGHLLLKIKERNPNDEN